MKLPRPTSLRFHNLLPLAACLFAGVLVPAATAADFTVKIVDKAPPAALDAAVGGLLQPKAVQVIEGGQTVFEFWFRTEVPLQVKPANLAKALDTVKQTTLLGAVAVASSRRDYRDDEIPAGVFTLRLALQPQDGNHLGTAEFSWFALLVAAKYDPKPDGIADYKSLVKASSKDTSTDHPILLSLRPAVADGDETTVHTPAPDHKSVRIRLPAKAGDEKLNLEFDLVIAGLGKK